MKRRDFIKSALATGISLSCGSALAGVTGTEQLDGSNHKETIAQAGIKDIEGLFSQFHPGDLIIIGSMPGIPKIDFSYKMAKHFIGADMKEPVAIFNYEITKENMLLHMLTRGFYDEDKDLLLRVRSNNLHKKDWVKLIKAAADISQYPIFIDDSTSAIELLCSKTKTIDSTHQQGLGIVIIDCLQFLKGSRNGEQDMFEASKALKGLAVELNIPVAVFSYLRKNAKLKADKEPVPADLGIIEQNADMVVFLHGNNIDTVQQPYAERHIKVIVAKNRYGETGAIKLLCHGDYFHFDCA